MIGKLALIAIAILIRTSTSSYSYTSSMSTCITYENSALYKWCRYSTTTSSGYAWDASDTSSFCGGSSNYRCSSDSSSYLPQNSKKLLCPTDYTNCYSLS